MITGVIASYCRSYILAFAWRSWHQPLKSSMPIIPIEASLVSVGLAGLSMLSARLVLAVAQREQLVHELGNLSVAFRLSEHRL